jgi:hypothetical protein
MVVEEVEKNVISPVYVTNIGIYGVINKSSQKKSIIYVESNLIQKISYYTFQKSSFWITPKFQ